MSYLLGISSGGTFVKAGIYDELGQEIALSRRTINIIAPHAGWQELDLQEFWQETSAVIQDVLSSSELSPSLIKGIGISSQGKGLYLLNKNKQVFTNGIMSSDQRSLPIVKRWYDEQVSQDVYLDSLHTIWSGHPVSILRWLKENDRDIYDNIGYILMSHDYLRFCLTGDLGCELTNISESNLYNMRTNNYDLSLADRLGISECFSCLPRIVSSTEIIGTLTPSASESTGLPVGLPVVGGLFDVVATALCSGVHDDKHLNTVLGSWSITTGITKEIKLFPDHPFTYGSYILDGHYQVHEGSPTSSGNLGWFNEQFYYNSLDYDTLNYEASSLPKASSNILFLPFLYGSNAGLGMPGCFYGLQQTHERRHLIQAMYEGVIFSHYTHIRTMRKLFPNISSLLATGGPTRSPVWMQLLADITGLDVEVSSIEETGCFGSALSAGIGCGFYQDFFSALSSFSSPQKTYTPDLSIFSAYQEKYSRYLKLIDFLQNFENSF